jgi:hypothetical protein
VAVDGLEAERLSVPGAVKVASPLIFSTDPSRDSPGGGCGHRSSGDWNAGGRSMRGRSRLRRAGMTIQVATNPLSGELGRDSVHGRDAPAAPVPSDEAVAEHPRSQVGVDKHGRVRGLAVLELEQERVGHRARICQDRSHQRRALLPRSVSAHRKGRGSPAFRRRWCWRPAHAYLV